MLLQGAAVECLQRYTRGWVARKTTNKFSQILDHYTALRLQTWWRNILARKSAAAAEEKEEELQCMNKYLEHHCGVPRWILKEPKRHKWQWQWARRCNVSTMFTKMGEGLAP